MKILHRLAFAGVLLVGLQSASADPVTYTLNFWGITDDDDPETTNRLVNIQDGMAQLRVDVSAASLDSNVAVFKFYHVDTTQMAVSRIYFDADMPMDITALNGSPGVSFSEGGSPPDLPGGNSISPQFEVSLGLLATADKPPPWQGVSPGEWLNVTMDLKNGTFRELLSDLGDGGLRVGMHVIGFADGGSESFVSNPVVPLPPAAWGGLALMGAIGVARYRARRRAMA